MNREVGVSLISSWRPLLRILQEWKMFLYMEKLLTPPCFNLPVTVHSSATQISLCSSPTTSINNLHCFLLVHRDSNPLIIPAYFYGPPKHSYPTTSLQCHNPENHELCLHNSLHTIQNENDINCSQ